MSIKNEVNGYFIKGLFGWRSEKVGGQNMRKGQKSGMIEKIYFSLMCLVGRMEKQIDRKLTYFIKKKNKMIENII